MNGTKIIMFDGSVKAIENIEVGDLVMGPDSLSRTVLSTEAGSDDIYEVTPTKGSKIFCTLTHKLSVKGLNPSTRRDFNRPKTYVVQWAIQGITKSKYFLTEHETTVFCENLPHEEIFDLSIRDYFNLTQSNKTYCYLYHTGVNFDQKEVPIDPYIIGFWLGDGTSSSPQITTIDMEIIEYFKEELLNIILKYTSRNQNP